MTKLDVTIIVLPVGLGGLIYFFFYPDSIIFKRFFANDVQFLADLKNCIEILLPTTSYRLYIQSVPSGLWSFSFIYSQLIVLTNNKKRNFSEKLLLSLNVLIVICFEIFQKESMNIIPGTYDPNDLILSLLGVFIAYLVFLFCKKHK